MIIAIDYDGTIADTNGEKARWVAEYLGISVDPWQCSRTECVPIIGEEAYTRMGNYVYERESTLRAVEVPGSLEAIRRLASTAELHIITARPESRIVYAREWLEKHAVLDCFAGIDTSSGGPSKGDLCSAIKADFLIDDDVRHLSGIDGDTICILLHSGRTQTGASGIGRGIRQCGAWSQVLDIISADGSIR